MSWDDPIHVFNAQCHFVICYITVQPLKILSTCPTSFFVPMSMYLHYHCYMTHYICTKESWDICLLIPPRISSFLAHLLFLKLVYFIVRFHLLIFGNFLNCLNELLLTQKFEQNSPLLTSTRKVSLGLMWHTPSTTASKTCPALQPSQCSQPLTLPYQWALIFDPHIFLGIIDVDNMQLRRFRLVFCCSGDHIWLAYLI